MSSADEALAIANDIRARARATLLQNAPLGLIQDYNDVKALDQNIGTIPAGFGGEEVSYDLYDPGTGSYLSITPYGWSITRQDYSTLNPSGWAIKRASSSFGALTHELPAFLASTLAAMDAGNSSVGIAAQAASNEAGNAIATTASGSGLVGADVVQQTQATTNGASAKPPTGMLITGAIIAIGVIVLLLLRRK